MGSICDEVDERMREEMHRNDPPRCKHGQMLCYGCWYCKTDDRLDSIEKALGIGENNDNN